MLLTLQPTTYYLQLITYNQVPIMFYSCFFFVFLGMVDRFVAVRCWIGDLLSSQYVQQDSEPNYVLFLDGSRASRVMLVGVVVSSGDELSVDDGSGIVVVRSFEGLPSVAPGSFVRVMGRPRSFDGQIYVVSEFVRVADSRWLELQKRVLSRRQAVLSDESVAVVDSSKDAVEVVRRLDSGDGADYSAVVLELGVKGEEIIVHLLSMGELFETRPGRLKVLE